MPLNSRGRRAARAVGFAAVVGCLGFTSHSLLAAEGQDLPAQVHALVRQLDSKELLKRDGAEQALRALGPAALPHLPKDITRLPAETRQRLSRVRLALEQVQAEASVEPSRITLHSESMPLDKVLAALAEQSGNTIVDHREQLGQEVANPKIRCDFEKTLFWTALDEVLDRAEVSLYPYGGRGIFIAARSEGELPRAHQGVLAGPLRLRPAQLELVRNFRQARGDSCKLFMECMWEPRLKPIVISQPLADLEIVGDDGAALNVDERLGEREVAVDADSNAVELVIPLNLPARAVKRLASVKGKLVLLVPGPIAEFHFEKLPIAADGAAPAKVEQKQGGVTVSVDQLRKNQTIWELRMHVRFDEPGSALESHRQWVLSNEAFLQAAGGQPIEYGGYEQIQRTDNEIGLMYAFNEDQLGPDPAKLSFTYKTPSVIIELPVDFELRDIELP